MGFSNSNKEVDSYKFNWICEYEVCCVFISTCQQICFLLLYVFFIFHTCHIEIIIFTCKTDHLMREHSRSSINVKVSWVFAEILKTMASYSYWEKKFSSKF